MSDLSLIRQLAQNVRESRRRKGWSQEELAERCGLHRTYVGAIERGETNVTLSTLATLARALSVQPYTLLTEAKWPSSRK